MKFKNKSLLKVAALSIFAVFSFGLVANVAFSKNENTQVSASADQGTWTTTNDNGLSFSYKSGTSSWFVNRTEQTAVYGLGDGKYSITYNVWGYKSGAMQPEEDLLEENIELQFIWGDYVESNTSDTYGTITAYPFNITGLSSTEAVSIDVLVEPTGNMALTYPTWRYNIWNQNFVYYVDSQNTYDAELTTISFINYGQDNLHNYIRLDYDVTENGSLVRRDSIGLVQASVLRYGDSAGDGAVAGTYKNQPVAELGTGQISIDEVTIANGFNYIEIYNEVIKYNEGDDSVQTVVINQATYNTNSSTVNIFYVLRDESGQDSEYTEECVLTNVDYSYDDELQRYYITGTTGDFDGIDEGRRITLYTRNLEMDSSYNFVVHFDGNGATSGTMSDDSFTSPEYSLDYELPECNFEREDYAFFAWSPSEGGMITIKPYEKRNISYSEDGETFYAIWGRTIRFDSNGGDGNMKPLVVKEGYNEVPSCDFTRDGYDFKCWAVGSPTGDEVKPGSNVYVNDNYVLYAVWHPNNAAIEIEEDEVVVYVGEEYHMQYKILPEGYEASIFATVEQGRVADVYVEVEIVISGLSAGTTEVTLSDEYGLLTKTFTLYVVEPPEPVEPENKINPQTIIEINTELADPSLGLSSDQIEQISGFINNNKDYISDDAGNIVSEALGNTTIDSSKDYADAQKSLVVTVVETGLMVDAGKATSLSSAQEIDKGLPSDVNFSVESEIDEFYQRQMVELFGGQMPSRRIVRAGTPAREIDIDPTGREGAEAIEYLGNEETLYKKMVGFVDNSVDHMGKAALKIRKCSGESVVVQVKSYVTVVKVSSFRDFDKEAADKEFVEAAYKAILLSMQNEVISILEKEHEPSNNAEKEAQYQKELDAVKDYETFEIMVTEVLRQKYNTIAKEPIDDVDEFKPVYREIFEAWALDKQSKYGITLEELTKATIEQSTSRARTFTIHSDLSTNEWIFIGAIAGGAALVITASAVIPTLLKKKKAKEGIN